MKRFLLILVLLLWTTVANSALVEPATAWVELAWDPSPDPTVTEIRLYWGTQSRAYRGFFSMPGNASGYTVHNLQPGVTYYFAATAWNGLESDYSDEVRYITSGLPVPRRPLPPSNFHQANQP